MKFSAKWSFLSLAEKYPKFVLSLVALSLLPSFLLISKLSLDVGFEDLLPKDNRYVKILREIPERIGSMAYLKVAVLGSERQKVITFAETLASQLEKSDQVRYLVKNFNGKFFKDHLLLYMDYQDLASVQQNTKDWIAYEKLTANPFYFDLAESKKPQNIIELLSNKYKSKTKYKDDKYLINRQGDTLFLLVKPKGLPGNVSYSRQLLKEVRAIVKKLNPEKYHAQLEVQLLGPFRTNLEEYQTLVKDITSTVALSLLLLFLLFYLYYRRLKTVLWIVAPPLVGVIWTFALASLTIGSINTQTAFLAAILLGLVIDFSIHLTGRYQEERSQGREKLLALEFTFKNTGKAVTACAATTFLAFFSLVFTDLVGFWQFGFLAASGIALSLLANLLVFPSLAMLTDRAIKEELSAATVASFVEVVVQHFKPSQIMKRLALFLFISLAILSLVFIGKIDFEYNLEKLRSKKQDYEEITGRLDKILGHGVTPSAIFLLDNIAQLKELNKRLKELKAQPQTTIKEIKSALSLIPERQQEKLTIIAKLDKLLQENEKYLSFFKKQSQDLTAIKKLLKVKKITLDKIPQDILRQFRDSKGEISNFIYLYSKNLSSDIENMLRHARETSVVKTESGHTYYSSGEAIIFSEMLRLMKRDGKRAILFSFLAVFLVIFLASKSWRATLTILSPLLLAVTLLCGTMALLQIKLNFFNMIVFPLILGIGVDNAIHLYLRFLESGRNIKKTLQSAGGAVTMSSLTTIIGFSALLIAQNQALNSIGLLALIGVFLCWLTSIAFLPLILGQFKHL